VISAPTRSARRSLIAEPFRAVLINSVFGRSLKATAPLTCVLLALTACSGVRTERYLVDENYAAGSPSTDTGDVPAEGTETPGAGGSAGSIPKVGNSGTAGAGAEPGSTDVPPSTPTPTPSTTPPPPPAPPPTALSVALDPSRISALPDCALARAGQCVVPITRSKAEVCSRFATDWPKRGASDYTLPSDSCSPAALGSEARADALRRVNFYRWLAALPPVSLNDEWSAYSSACAVMQSHLGDVSHHPSSSAACYSALGATASEQSLLALGAHTPADAVDDLVWDAGARNLHELGHRWALLHPGLSELGVGFAYPQGGRRATCMRETAGSPLVRAADLSGVVTYPSYGRSPFELVDREASAHPSSDALEWSLTLGDSVSISGASMRLYREDTGAYVPVAATSGTIAMYHGLWLDPAEPLEPATYVVLVSGTGLGDFGYRVEFERCAGDAPLSCNVLAQDCGVAGYGCYEPDAPFCSPSGKLPVGTACHGNLLAECAPGAVCVENPSVRDGFACAAYCDANDAHSPAACAKLCAGSAVRMLDPKTSNVVGAYCDPGSGSTCNPLAQNCGSGQACYDWEPARCLDAGKLGEGEKCTFANDCAKGLACTGVGSLKCLPYCDPNAHGTPSACSTLCPGSFWDYDSFGVCRH